MNKISNILTIKNRLNGLKIAYPSNSIGQSNENVYSKEKSNILKNDSIKCIDITRL